MTPTFEVVGYTYNGQAFCIDCAETTTANSEVGLPVESGSTRTIKDIAENDRLDGGPIFRDSESDSPQTCEGCGRTIDNTVLETQC